MTTTPKKPTKKSRKKTKMKRNGSGKQYRILFESNPQPMWVYDLGTLSFLAVNDAAVYHYGYSRDEFLSMTINRKGISVIM